MNKSEDLLKDLLSDLGEKAHFVEELNQHMQKLDKVASGFLNNPDQFGNPALQDLYTKALIGLAARQLARFMVGLSQDSIDEIGKNIYEIDKNKYLEKISKTFEVSVEFWLKGLQESIKRELGESEYLARRKLTRDAIQNMSAEDDGKSHIASFLKQ